MTYRCPDCAAEHDAADPEFWRLHDCERIGLAAIKYDEPHRLMSVPPEFQDAPTEYLAGALVKQIVKRAGIESAAKLDFTHQDGVTQQVVAIASGAAATDLKLWFNRLIARTMPQQRTIH